MIEQSPAHILTLADAVALFVSVFLLCLFVCSLFVCMRLFAGSEIRFLKSRCPVSLSGVHCQSSV